MRWLLVIGVLVTACTTEDAAPVQVPSVSPAPPIQTDEDRKARFNARDTAPVPKDLPSPWKRFLTNLDARVLNVTHHVWSYQTDWRGGREIKLRIRVFGLDGKVDATVHSALSKLKLPKLASSLRDQTVTQDRTKWSLTVDRVVAPAGAQRETQIELAWSRQPKTNGKERGACRKPHPVPAPSAVPGWLAKITRKMSTRRRILSESKNKAGRKNGQMQLLYHNGFAHDENVGQLTTAAQTAGLHHKSGTGPKQVWAHRDGRKMSLRPVRDVHDMGCNIRGPVLQVKWRGPKTKRSNK